MKRTLVILPLGRGVLFLFPSKHGLDTSQELDDTRKQCVVNQQQQADELLNHNSTPSLGWGNEKLLDGASFNAPVDTVACSVLQVHDGQFYMLKRKAVLNARKFTVLKTG